MGDEDEKPQSQPEPSTVPDQASDDSTVARAAPAGQNSDGAPAGGPQEPGSSPAQPHDGGSPGSPGKREKVSFERIQSGRNNRVSEIVPPEQYLQQKRNSLSGMESTDGPLQSEEDIGDLGIASSGRTLKSIKDVAIEIKRRSYSRVPGEQVSTEVRNTFMRALLRQKQVAEASATFTELDKDTIAALSKTVSTRTESDFEKCRALASTHPAFVQFDPQVAEALACGMRYLKYGGKKAVIRQGEYSECLYILLRGRVSKQAMSQDQLAKAANAKTGGTQVIVPDGVPFDPNASNSEWSFEEQKVVNRMFGPKLAVFETGALIGHMALAMRRKLQHTYSIVTIGDCDVGIISKREIPPDLLKEVGKAVASCAPPLSPEIFQTPPEERSPGMMQAIVESVQYHPFFQQFPESSLLKLCKKLEFQQLKGGYVCCVEGQQGTQFTVLLTGSVAVYYSDNLQLKHADMMLTAMQVNTGNRSLTPAELEDVYGRKVAILNPGDGFGDKSLRNAVPCKATVVTTEPAELLSLSRNAYYEAVGNQTFVTQPELFRSIMAKAPQDRSVRDLKYIQETLESNTYFKNLDSKMAEEVYKVATYTTCERGQVLFMQGAVGDSFFVILCGTLNLHQVPEDTPVPEHKQELKWYEPGNEMTDAAVGPLMTSLHAGAAMGELSILQDKPRMATCVAEEYSQLIVLSKEAYQRIMAKREKALMDRKINFLQNISLFRNFSPKVLVRVTYAMKNTSFPYKVKIYTQGQAVAGLSFMVSGEVRIVQAARSPDPPYAFRRIELAVLGVGKYIGECCMLGADGARTPSPHDVIAGSAVEVYMLAPESRSMLPASFLTQLKEEVQQSDAFRQQHFSYVMESLSNPIRLQAEAKSAKSELGRAPRKMDDKYRGVNDGIARSKKHVDPEALRRLGAHSLFEVQAAGERGRSPERPRPESPPGPAPDRPPHSPARDRSPSPSRDHHIHGEEHGEAAVLGAEGGAARDRVSAATWALQTAPSAPGLPQHEPSAALTPGDPRMRPPVHMPGRSPVRETPSLGSLASPLLLSPGMSTETSLGLMGGVYVGDHSPTDIDVTWTDNQPDQLSSILDDMMATVQPTSSSRRIMNVTTSFVSNGAVIDQEPRVDSGPPAFQSPAKTAHSLPHSKAVKHAGSVTYSSSPQRLKSDLYKLAEKASGGRPPQPGPPEVTGSRPPSRDPSAAAAAADLAQAMPDLEPTPYTPYMKVQVRGAGPGSGHGVALSSERSVQSMYVGQAPRAPEAASALYIRSSRSFVAGFATDPAPVRLFSKRGGGTPGARTPHQERESPGGAPPELEMRFQRPQPRVLGGSPQIVRDVSAAYSTPGPAHTPPLEGPGPDPSTPMSARPRTQAGYRQGGPATQVMEWQEGGGGAPRGSAGPRGRKASKKPPALAQAQTARPWLGSKPGWTKGGTWAEPCTWRTFYSTNTETYQNYKRFLQTPGNLTSAISLPTL